MKVHFNRRSLSKLGFAEWSKGSVHFDRLSALQEGLVCASMVVVR